MSDTEPTYDETLKSMVDSGESREDILGFMEKHNDRVIDLDNLPSLNHRWVDRGAVMSCEGAAHDNHHAYKQLR